MKKLFLVLLALGLLTSCARITINPETGYATYTRIGDQHIQGFTVTKTENGFSVGLEGQQAEGEALNKALETIQAMAGGK